MLRRIKAKGLALLLPLALLAGGCEGEGGDVGEGDAGGERAFVSVSVSEGEGSAWASVGNRGLIPWPRDEVARAGDCAFFEPRPPSFCDPECELPERCADGGVCIAPSAPVDAGTITVDGLAVGLTLAPVTEWKYYVPTWDPEPVGGELFATGATLTASATGGETGPFTATTRGVAPLETELGCPPERVADVDLEVRWQPGDSGDAVIRFAMESGNHGDMFAGIRCETADTGLLVVDGALVRRHLESFRPVETWSLVRAVRGEVTTPVVRAVFEASSVRGCNFDGL